MTEDLARRVREIEAAYSTVFSALVRANQEIASLWRLIDERCEECGQKITQHTGFVLDEDDWLFCSVECQDRRCRRWRSK